jgi:hypothetical protein
MPIYTVPTKIQDRQNNWVYLPGHFLYQPYPRGHEKQGQYPDIGDALLFWLTRLEDTTGKLTITVPVGDNDPNWGLVPRCWNNSPTDPTVIRFRRYMADGVTPAVYCIEYGLPIGRAVRLNGTEYPETQFGMPDYDDDWVFVVPHYWKNTVFDLNGARFVQYDTANTTITYQNFYADMVGNIRGSWRKTDAWVTDLQKSTLDGVAGTDPLTPDSSWIGLIVDPKSPTGATVYPANTTIVEIDAANRRFRTSNTPYSSSFPTGVTEVVNAQYSVQFRTLRNVEFYNPVAPDGTTPAEMDPFTDKTDPTVLVNLDQFADCTITASTTGTSVKAKYGYDGNWVSDITTNVAKPVAKVVNENWFQTSVAASKTSEGAALYPSGTTIVDIDFANNRFKTSNPPNTDPATGEPYKAVAGVVSIAAGAIISGGKKVLTGTGAIVLEYDGDETIGEANRYTMYTTQSRAVNANFTRYRYKGQIKFTTTNLRKKNGMNMISFNSPFNRPKRFHATWTAGSNLLTAAEDIFEPTDVGWMLGDSTAGATKWPTRGVVLEYINARTVRLSISSYTAQNNATPMAIWKIRGAVTENITVLGRTNTSIPRATLEMSNYLNADAVPADKEPWHSMMFRACQNINVSEINHRYTWADIYNFGTINVQGVDWIQNAEDVTITNCTAQGAGRHFITAQGNNGLTIRNCKFYGSKHWSIDTESLSPQARMTFMEFDRVTWGGQTLGFYQIKTSPNNYIEMPIKVRASGVAGSTTLTLSDPLHSRWLTAKLRHDALDDYTVIRQIDNPLTITLNKPLLSNIVNEDVLVYDPMLYAFVDIHDCTFGGIRPPAIASPDDVSGTQVWGWSRQYFLADTVQGDYRLRNVRLCDANGVTLTDNQRLDGKKWPLSRKDIWVRTPLIYPSGWLAANRNSVYIDILGSRTTVPTTAGSKVGDAYIVMGRVWVWSGTAWTDFGPQIPTGRLTVSLQRGTLYPSLYEQAPRVVDTNGSNQLSVNIAALETRTNVLFSASIAPLWWWGFRFSNNRIAGDNSWVGEHSGYTGRSTMIALHSRWDLVEITNNVAKADRDGSNQQIHYMVGQWQNNKWWTWGAPSATTTNTTYLRSLDGNNETFTGPSATEGNYQSWNISNNYWIDALDNQFTPSNVVTPSVTSITSPIRGRRYTVNARLTSTSSGNTAEVVDEPIALYIVDDELAGDVTLVGRLNTTTAINATNPRWISAGPIKTTADGVTGSFITTNYFRTGPTTASVYAVYPGSLTAQYARSSALPVSRSVATSEHVTETTVQLWTPFSAPGQTVEITVSVVNKTPVTEVAGGSNNPPPTGTVTLYGFGGTVLATGTLAAGAYDSATGVYAPSTVLLTRAFAAGLYPVYATYTPSGSTFLTSTSDVVYQWATNTPSETTTAIVEADASLTAAINIITSTLITSSFQTVSVYGELSGIGNASALCVVQIDNSASFAGNGVMVASVDGRIENAVTLTASGDLSTIFGSPIAVINEAIVLSGVSDINALEIRTTLDAPLALAGQGLLTLAAQALRPNAAGPFSGWITNPG